MPLFKNKCTNIHLFFFGTKIRIFFHIRTKKLYVIKHKISGVPAARGL
jgi:hypothetical protein